MVKQTSDTTTETSHQIFERVLAREPFKGLKAILEGLSSDRTTLCEEVHGTASYEELVTRLGYRMNLIPQIHVQDSYSRVGREGGIKAVLPYHDIPSQSSLPTLINFDGTLTTTAKGAAFFDKMLAALKTQLRAEK